MSILAYRKDIDGLRAIAVLAVMLFHARPEWLPGGFVGVDVFFVISGFLISGIIHRQSLSGAFSFSDFYARRIRRIFPVFYLILLLVLLAGYFILLADDAMYMLKSASYAIFFVSNIYFSRATDYFSPDMDELPLLHTWSLGDEEQFYLVWPLLLIILAKKPGLFRPAIIVMALFSFGLSLFLLQKEVTAMSGFYLLPARMWEFLLGALLAVQPFRHNISGLTVSLLASAGTAMLALSVFLLDRSMSFPGYNALWPCLGALLLIAAGSVQGVHSPVSKLLESGILVFIGKLSYSLYLWHWPVFVFARYTTLQEQLSLTVMVICVLLVFTLAYFSWKYIEQPLRKNPFSLLKTIVFYAVLPTLLLLVMIAVMKVQVGARLQADEALLEVKNFQLGCHNRIFDDCHIGAEKPQEAIKTIMFGDSHARHFAMVFDAMASQHRKGLDFYAANSCGFMFGLPDNVDENCSNMTNHVEARLANYENIIIALRWSTQLQFMTDENPQQRDRVLGQLQDRIRQWTQAGKKVYLVAQVPEYRQDVLQMQAYGKGDNPLQSSYRLANAALRKIAAQNHNVFIVDFSPVMEDWRNGMEGDMPMYADAHHLSKAGQKRLLEQVSVSGAFDELFDNL